MTQTVYIVDDDPSLCQALGRLLESDGYEVYTFRSAEEFLNRAEPPTGPSCIVVDFQMPGLNGLDLQQECTKKLPTTHFVFITGHARVPMAVQALKAGAVDFLAKPFANEELLRAVAVALARSTVHTRSSREAAAAKARIAKLTPRELEVFHGITAGLLNKEIAATLGISERTVKIHRGRVMHKMRATSVADLVQLSYRSGIASENEDTIID